MTHYKQMQSSHYSPSWLRLLDDGEPFRLLFSVAVLLGMLGLVLWPLHVFGLIESWPGLAHSRIMIQGHMTAFVMGFLGTALPRMLEVRGFGAAHAIAGGAALVLLSLLHLLQLHLAGDGLYLLVLGAFLALLARRWQARLDMPPPAFVLVLGGLLCALLGTALQIAIQTVPALLPGLSFPLARLLLNQAFLLLPLMGVGAFFMPRFFGSPNRQDVPESRLPTTLWYRRAAFAALCGLALLASFVLEAGGLFRVAVLLRAAVLLFFFIREVTPFRQFGPAGSLATAARIALGALPVGYLFMAVFPLYQTSFAHVVFISGFSLITFTVACWVAFGHSGQRTLLKAPLWSVRLFTALLLLAMLTRVSADWMPEVRLTHYAYAALAWIAAATFFAAHLLPAIRRPD